MLGPDLKRLCWSIILGVMGSQNGFQKDLMAFFTMEQVNTI